jgi:hypothetical protein
VLVAASSATTARSTSAAASAATITTAPSAACAPATASATSTAFARRSRLIYDDAAAHEIVAIKRLNRTPCIIITVHFYETESAGLTREAVAYQSDIRGRNAYLRKPSAQVLFSRLKGQVAHVQFFHETYSLASG